MGTVVDKWAGTGSVARGPAVTIAGFDECPWCGKLHWYSKLAPSLAGETDNEQRCSVIRS